MPETVKQTLQHIEGVRWQAPEQMHLTLNFWVRSIIKKAKHLTQKLAEIEHANFTISVTGTGYVVSRT